MTETLLEARDLTKSFPLKGHLFGRGAGSVEAVKNLNLTLRRGESVGLVGESGCGKSTLARLLCRLIRPTSGSILYKGLPLESLRGQSLKQFRRSVQIIFQDPAASLNPLMRVGEILAEPMAIHGIAKGRELERRVQTLLQEVGLDPTWVNRFPRTLSGGQGQRVGIARALSLNPQLLICDEPVSSLDLSIQAQILKLLTELQAKRGLTLLFISHNLATISAISDRILVMRSGQILEEGPNPKLFKAPQHPYTRQLVNLALQTI